MYRLHPWLVPILGLAVLLVSTTGLVGHEHGFSTELTTYACSADHGSEHGESHGRGIHAGSDEHQHVCPGCHLNGQRLLRTAPRGVAAARIATHVVTAFVQPSPRLVLWAHPPRRGPPSA